MSRRPSFFTWTVPLLLFLQLGMLWIQGVQLHQQNQLLKNLRGDIQDLADSLDNSQDSTDTQDGGTTVPLCQPIHHRAPRRLQRVSLRSLQGDPDPAMEDAEKDLKAARDSAQKAVKEAREDRSKLSLEENARKAEEARKVRGATDAWQKWSLVALGLLVLAWLAKAYLRRR